jgi:hypothetical protein
MPCGFLLRLISAEPDRHQWTLFQAHFPPRISMTKATAATRLAPKLAALQLTDSWPFAAAVITFGISARTSRIRQRPKRRLRA